MKTEMRTTGNAGVNMIPGRTDGAVYINASGTLLLQLGTTIIAAYTGGREVQTLANVQYVRGGVTAIAAWKRWVCEQLGVGRLGSFGMDEEGLRAIAAVSISNAYLGVGALRDTAYEAAKKLDEPLRSAALYLGKTWTDQLYTSATTVALQMRETKKLAAQAREAKRAASDESV